MNDQRKILIDTDPGIDDSLALLLAVAAQDRLELCAVTTVAGNVPLATTTANARSVLALAGVPGIPVVAGAAKPLKRPLHMATENHGENGQGDIAQSIAEDYGAHASLDLVNAVTQVQPAAAFLANTILSAPGGTYTLCCLAPLTNIARALKSVPHIASLLREIVIIGGSVFAGGNVTPTAEFNFYVDPDAADIVLNSGANLTLIPWDAAKQALTATARRTALAAIGLPLAPIVTAWIDSYRAFDEKMWGTDGGALPDPLAIAYLLAPDLFQGRRINVSIETRSDLMRGAVAADWWGYSGRPANALVMKDVDADGYFNLLTHWLRRLNERLAPKHHDRSLSRSV